MTIDIHTIVHDSPMGLSTLLFNSAQEADAALFDIAASYHESPPDKATMLAHAAANEDAWGDFLEKSQEYAGMNCDSINWGMEEIEVPLPDAVTGILTDLAYMQEHTNSDRLPCPCCQCKMVRSSRQILDLKF